MNLDSIISDLITRGMIRIDNSAVHDIDKKIKQFEYLIRKSNTTNVEQKYLSLYDSLFRLFEIALAKSNCVLTNVTPHRALKESYHYLFPGLDENIKLDQLVQLRHLIKKKGLTPNIEDFKKLEDCVEHARSFIKI
jgi:hypothetical protein